MKRTVVALTVLLALSCVRKEAPAKLTKVRLNQSPTLSHAPFVIARDEGFFAAEGIDPEFVSVDSNSGILGLNAGKLDVFSGAIRMGMFNMMARGMPLRVVADKGHASDAQCVNEAFTAPPAAAARIAAAGGSLRGERVAAARGGVAEYLTELFLAQRKTSPPEVTFIDLPQGAAASMRTDIDAVRHMTDPHLSNGLAEKRLVLLESGDRLSPGHQTAVLVYGKRLLQDDRDLGRRFMRAYLRGVRRYNEGKTARNVAIISRLTKQSPAEIRRSCWVAIASDGQIQPEAVERVLRWGLRRGYLAAPIATKQWWDPSFLAEGQS